MAKQIFAVMLDAPSEGVDQRIREAYPSSRQHSGGCIS